MTRKQPEKTMLLEPAIDYLTARHIMHKHLTTCVHRRIGARFHNIPVDGNIGWPDLEIYPANGRVFFVEFKTPRGSMSKEQREVKAMLEQRGYQVYIVRDFAAFRVIVDAEMFRRAI